MKKALFIPLAFCLFACQPSKITQTWSADNISQGKYKKILVLGVLSDNDYELQTRMENHLAGDLGSLGYYAIAANSVFPAGTFVKGDTLRARNAIEGKGFDAVLTVLLLDKAKESYFVPDRMSDNNNNFNQYGAFNRYYNTMAGKIYTPGYYGEETKYVWENNFYDLVTGQMIYSARSRSFDYASKNTLAHGYGLMMAQNLVKKKILSKPDRRE